MRTGLDFLHYVSQAPSSVSEAFKVSQAGGPKVTDMYSLTVLKAQSQKPRRGQGSSPSEAGKEVLSCLF